MKACYFDPAAAFETKVDWSRFRSAQIKLFLISLVMPFFMLLLLGVVLGVLYMTGASLYSTEAPNPIYQLILYPVVYVLARGYWVAYLALPLGLFAMGWLWAGPTAWILSKYEGGANIDFKKALSILAMFGAMLAPFTMFPFLRLVALAVVLWIIVKRMEDTFDIGFWHFVGRGGVLFILAMGLYGAYERKVESYFSGAEELQANLTSFIRDRKMLEWPSFRRVAFVDPNERIYNDLSDFTPKIREAAVAKALAMLKAGGGTPELRFRFAKSMSDHGQTEAFIYLSRYYATGQGAPADPAQALEWSKRFTDANRGNLDAGLERVRLMIQNAQRLEGKRYLVGIAKDQPGSIGKIADFVQKEGLGKADNSLTYEVQSLYQVGNTQSTVGTYVKDASTGRYTYETQTKQGMLSARLYASAHDQSLWFYRALVSEYGQSASAGPEAYGEAATDFGQDELAQKIKEGDPVAMDIVADRCAHDGDIVKARQFWVAATQVLNNDNRVSNVAYYIKLALSYDPGESSPAPDPREAVKYYQAALLISSQQGRAAPVGMASLQRLQGGKVPDPLSQPFLDLCLKSDIPEAWVMMGTRYLNGDIPGVPKHEGKARECFQRAKALGYKGPQFQRQLELMGG
ncbi:MAG TPA: hypothetical protein VJ623_03545 [Holophagaceae bacterium]|nr:hypothetical protein [Holophagaceae bacterium]